MRIDLVVAGILLVLWSGGGGVAAYSCRPWIALACGVMAGGSIWRLCNLPR